MRSGAWANEDRRGVWFIRIERGFGHVLHFEGFSKLLVGTCVPLSDLDWWCGFGFEPQGANEETTQPPNRGAPSK